MRILPYDYKKGACGFLRRIIGKRVEFSYGPAAVLEDLYFIMSLGNWEDKNIVIIPKSEDLPFVSNIYIVTSDDDIWTSLF